MVTALSRLILVVTTMVSMSTASLTVSQIRQRKADAKAQVCDPKLRDNSWSGCVTIVRCDSVHAGAAGGSVDTV